MLEFYPDMLPEEVVSGNFRIDRPVLEVIAELACEKKEQKRSSRRPFDPTWDTRMLLSEIHRICLDPDDFDVMFVHDALVVREEDPSRLFWGPDRSVYFRFVHGLTVEDMSTAREFSRIRDLLDLYRCDIESRHGLFESMHESSESSHDPFESSAEPCPGEFAP